MNDYLYEKDGSYNPRMVKKILKAAKDKSVIIFEGESASEDMMRWLKNPNQLSSDSNHLPESGNMVGEPTKNTSIDPFLEGIMSRDEPTKT